MEYKGSRRGQAVIMMTFGIVFLMGLMGLVVDVGWGYYRKQVAQAAADSAATAAIVQAGKVNTIVCGSNGIVCQTPTNCASAATGTDFKTACQYGAANGVANGNISVSAGTTSPINGVAVTYWVSVTVTEPMTPTFLRTMGFNSATVGATATAGLVSTGSGGGGGCLYVLDPSAGQALYINGASLALTCGIYVNSNNSTNAVTLSSANAFLCYGSAANTCSAGTLPVNLVTGAFVSCSGCGCNSAAPYSTSPNHPNGGSTCATPSYSAAAADPLASLPAPTFGACDHTNYSQSNLGNYTLNPGTYCGGINLGGGNFTFNAGNYILNGGGLKIQGSNTSASGSGVFFYNTSSGYTAGNLLMSGQPTVNFSAPTTGAYQGILFMQDHTVCPSTSHAINGNTNIQYSGSIYLHCGNTGGSYVAQNILYTGQSTTGHYSALVVDTMQINGMSNLFLDPTGGTNTGIGLNAGAKPFLIQ